MEDEIQRRCAECDRLLRLGVDVITLEHGVIGPRDVVPLQDVQLFCSDTCLKKSVEDNEVERLPRRIP